MSGVAFTETNVPDNKLYVPDVGSVVPPEVVVIVREYLSGGPAIIVNRRVHKTSHERKYMPIPVV